MQPDEQHHASVRRRLPLVARSLPVGEQGMRVPACSERGKGLEFEQRHR